MLWCPEKDFVTVRTGKEVHIRSVQSTTLILELKGNADLEDAGRLSVANTSM
jgi:hypothetical protein